MNPRHIIDLDRQANGFTDRDTRSPGHRKSDDRKKRIAELMAKGHTRARAKQLAKQH